MDLWIRMLLRRPMVDQSTNFWTLNALSTQRKSNRPTPMQLTLHHAVSFAIANHLCNYALPFIVPFPDNTLTFHPIDDSDSDSEQLRGEGLSETAKAQQTGSLMRLEPSMGSEQQRHKHNQPINDK